MRYELSILIALISLLFVQSDIEAITKVSPALMETAILKIDAPNDWKEISRYITPEEGMVERIRVNQTIKNWSDLIAIQYIDLSLISKEPVYSIGKIADQLRSHTLAAYPEGSVTWNIIEKNNKDIIYEWILHQPYNDIPPQHEISHAFLTTTRFHRVGFTRKNVVMSSEERNKWIQLLKESSSIVSLETANKNSDCLSLADVSKIYIPKDSSGLKSVFPNWKVLSNMPLGNGNSMICLIPPSQNENTYITEGLEVMNMPYLKVAGIDKIFEANKHNIQRDSNKKIVFVILKKTDDEVIYYYSYPKDHVQLTAVARGYISDQGYCEMTYKRGLPSALKKKEILEWAEKLEAIQFKDLKSIY